MKSRSRRQLLGSLGTAALAPFVIAPSDFIAAEGSVKFLRNMPRPQQKPTDSREVKEVAVDKVDCPSWPLQSLGAVTLEGSPQASGKTVFETDDHSITGGVWKCSPGTFDLTFTWDEMALLLEGELIIEEGNKKIHVQPGNFFFVPRGAKTRWTVVKPIKKVFFSRE